MHAMPRVVTPELLDDLDPRDPRALRSRRDLSRVHRAMRSVQILKTAIGTLPLRPPPRSIIELGAGDGTLLLRLARALGSSWRGAQLTLLDRHDLIAEGTHARFRELGWTVTVIEADVLEWSRPPVGRRYDLCLANLFLHHFKGAELNALLAGAAARTDIFIACEPRRDRFSALASRMIGLLGTNAVTRVDAVKSVAAGFTGHELGTVWATASGAWATTEYRALPFSHCFTAVRRGASGAADAR
jgi:hypothetical protein